MAKATELAILKTEARNTRRLASRVADEQARRKLEAIANRIDAQVAAMEAATAAKLAPPA